MTITTHAPDTPQAPRDRNARNAPRANAVGDAHAHHVGHALYQRARDRMRPVSTVMPPRRHEAVIGEAAYHDRLAVAQNPKH